MRRLLALLFLALPALGQVNVTTAPCKITDESCSRGVTSVPGGTTLAANVHTGTTFRATAPATVTITNATNATPIVVTAVAHGLVTGDAISISGITGNTNANGYFKITRLSADTFSLQNYSTGADIAGNGAYGGAPVAVTGIVQAQRVLVGDGTVAAPSIAWASDSTTGVFRSGSGTTSISSANFESHRFSAAGFYMFSNFAAISLGASSDTLLSRAAAATLQLGGANVTGAVAPVAQTLTVQSVGTTATADLAGADWTHKGSLGKGTAASGKHIFTVGTPQNTTVAHVPSTVLTLQDTGTAGTAAPQALFADGTAAKPSIATAGGSTTGIHNNTAAGAGIFVDHKATWMMGFDADNAKVKMAGTAAFGWVAATTEASSPDTMLTRGGAAATLQLGAANAASPVGQRLRSQGAATGTDIAGADLNISPGPMTGTGANYAAGRYGALRLGTYVPGTTGTTTSTTTTDRLVISGRPITLTAGSATNIVHIDIPALAGASWDITYSVKVTDSAAPVQMKVLGGRYYGSAYRLATGNAVPNAVAETGDNEVHSVGGAASDVMTFTGDATGVMVAHNITVGTGLTAPNTVVGSYMVTVSGAAAITVTPQ